MSGWVERQGSRTVAGFLADLRGYRNEGLDVTALVASDGSHVIAVVCEARALRTAHRPRLAFVGKPLAA